MSRPAAVALAVCTLLTTAANCAKAPAPGGVAAAAAGGTDTVRGTPGGGGIVAAPRGRAPAAPTPTPSQPPMRTLDAAAHLLTTTTAQPGEPGLQVVRDRAGWERAWGQLQGGAAAGPAPAVDFAREMVVVVAAGEKPSGGHAVRIDGTSTAADGALVVHVTETAPGEGCMSTMQMTAPVDVVRIPRVAGAVRANTRRVAEPC
jgi:hypothetical protein